MCERERESNGRDGETLCMKEREGVCVCVCERERESNGRDGETLCMKEREGVCV